MKTTLVGATLLVLSATLPASAGEQAGRVSLAPVPYALSLPQEIASHLSTGPLTGIRAEETRQAGSIASTLVHYRPEGGETSILMGVHYFPADRFDAAHNPQEPPPFGKEVLRRNGMVLSIAGPHDTIFDPATEDGRNVAPANELIYAPESYIPWSDGAPASGSPHPPGAGLNRAGRIARRGESA